MNKVVLSLSAVVALSGLIACASDGSDNVGAADQHATADIDHMYKRPDGKFDVTCADGTTEPGLTAEEINMNLACGGPGASGGTSGTAGSTSGGTSGTTGGSVEPVSCLNTTPIDATQFPYAKAKPKAPGSCSAADVSNLSAYYKAHVADNDFTTTAWQSAVPATCAQCVFSADEKAAPATAWGPVITVEDHVQSINRGGCIELATGSEACGRSYQQFQDCLLQACLVDCKTQTDFAACRGDARVLDTSCKIAADAVRTDCGTGISAAETACKGTTYTFEGPVKVACVNP